MGTRWKVLVVMLLLLALVGSVSAQEVKLADPSGAATGTMADVPAKEAGQPTLQEVAETAGHNKVSINMMWILLAGFLVMFMQAGFALAETGFTRARNVAHTMMMNFMVYAIGITGYWIMGFALHMGGIGALSTLGGSGVLDSEFTISLFGKDFGLFGRKGFFLGGTYDVAVYAIFLFQMVFMDTAATIPTGALAERWKSSLVRALASTVRMARLCRFQAITFLWPFWAVSFWPLAGLGLTPAARWLVRTCVLPSLPPIPCWPQPMASSLAWWRLRHRAPLYPVAGPL